MNDQFLLISGMMFVTILVRYPLLVIVGRVDLPGIVQKTLKYVPVAVLVSITVPAMVMPQGAIDLQFSNAYLYVGIFCILLSLWRKNLLLTIIAGMLIFFIWRSILA
ncbi:hypothetical protein MASR2M15_11310 [Anaerolineales bacterium]